MINLTYKILLLILMTTITIIAYIKKDYSMIAMQLFFLFLLFIFPLHVKRTLEKIKEKNGDLTESEVKYDD